MDGGHAAVGEGSEHHAEHGDENGGDDVTFCGFMDDSEERHGGRWLDHDDAGEDEGGEGERAAELCGHWGLLYNS